MTLHCHWPKKIKSMIFEKNLKDNKPWIFND